MEGENEKRTIGELIITYSGLIQVGISFITFLYLFPSSLNSISQIQGLEQSITGFPGLALNSIIIYLVLTGVLVLAGVGILSLFYHSDKFTMGFQKARGRKYFSYLMIYVLIQLILTEVFAFFVPNFGGGFPFDQTTGIQNFVFSYLTLEEGIIYQLIPLTVAVVVIAAVRGNLNLRSIIYYDLNSVELLVVSLFVALVATLFVSGTPLDYVSDFTSLFVLNIIFLRFGFLKAILTNFTIAMTNVTATLISGTPILSTILPIFLFFLGFLGIYSLVQVATQSPRGFPAGTGDKEQVQPQRPRRIVTIEPFIKSRCPDCGTALYHIIVPGMSLKCNKCGKELDKDATGEENIRIELSGSSRYELKN